MQMVYLEYAECKMQYDEAIRMFGNLIKDRERLFTLTQPKSMNYGSEKVIESHEKNKLDEYMIALEEVEHKIDVCKRTIEDQGMILKIRLNQLIKSDDRLDLVYYQRKVKHKSISDIINELGYSRTQLYRYLDKIDAEIELMRQNGTK